jgi:hypothetical protein
VELELRNVGFSAPHLPREVALVLQHPDRTLRVVLEDIDPRRWSPEAGPITLRGTIPIPADAPCGAWRLALHLADPSERLREDGRYAIRLAGKRSSSTRSGAGITWSKIWRFDDLARRSVAGRELMGVGRLATHLSTACIVLGTPNKMRIRP